MPGAAGVVRSRCGPSIIFNAWAASNDKVNRFLLQEARKIIVGKDTVYFKRYYKDGSTRPCACGLTISSRSTSNRGPQAQTDCDQGHSLAHRAAQCLP
jgi:hypothetical protein